MDGRVQSGFKNGRRMKIIDDQNLYRQLIPADAPLYVQPAWMDVFSEDWGARVGFSKSREPIWLRPVQEKLRFGIKKYGRIPYCPDNGPVFLSDAANSLFDPGIIRWFSMAVIDDRRNLLDLDEMLRMAWCKEDRFYQYFDLKNYPEDFGAVSRSKRRRMKKNSHFTFKRYDGMDQMSALLLASFHSMGYSNISMDVLRQWEADLEKSFDQYFWGLCDAQGNILSAQWLIGYEDTLYGWQAVRHPRFPNAGARELLLWYILQWARERYSIYDLGGSSIAGVRQFNLEMGAKEVAYYRYIRYRPGILSYF